MIKMDGITPKELEKLYDRLSIKDETDESDIRSALKKRWVKDKQTGQMTLREVRDSPKIKELSSELAKPSEIKREMPNVNNYTKLKEIRGKIDSIRIANKSDELYELAEVRKKEIISNLSQARAESKKIQKSELRAFALGSNPSEYGELTSDNVRRTRLTTVKTFSDYYSTSTEEMRSRLESLGFNINEDGRIIK